MAGLRDGKPGADDAAKARVQLEAKTAELRAMQGETPLIQVCVNVGMTRSPSRKRVTSEPKATTTPQASEPGMNGRSSLKPGR